MRGEWKSASEISTFKGGGKAFVIYPESVEKAIKTIGVLRSEKVDFSMLGKGSNTLVSDGECKQVLVSFKHINDAKIEGNFAVCEGCGGCPGKRAVARARMLVDRGAEAVALASCICKGNPISFPCPHHETMIAAIRKKLGDGVPVLDHTH